MMKRIMAIMMLLLLIEGISPARADQETILLVAQENYAPFQYFDEMGEARGLDIEIIQKAAELAQLNVSIQLVPWARALVMVKEGEADGVFGCGKKPEREEFLYFPETPLRYSEMVFFANDQFLGSITNLADLGNHVVGSVNKYFVSPEFETNSDIRKDFANSAESLFQKLTNYRHPLAVYNKIAGWDVVKRLGIKNVRILPYIIASYPSYLAFSKSSPKGQIGYEKFSEALKQLEHDGVLQAITQKYLAEPEMQGGKRVEVFVEKRE